MKSSGDAVDVFVRPATADPMKMKDPLQRAFRKSDDRFLQSLFV